MKGEFYLSFGLFSINDFQIETLHVAVGLQQRHYLDIGLTHPMGVWKRDYLDSGTDGEQSDSAEETVTAEH